MKKVLLFLGAGMLGFMHQSDAQQAPTVTNAGFETWADYSVSTSLTPGQSTIGLSKPASWSGLDSFLASVSPLAALGGYNITPTKQVYQSTEAHGGSYSARLVSAVVVNDSIVVPGILTNGTVSLTANDLLNLGSALTDTAGMLSVLSHAITGGTAVSAKVDTVSAWVKVDTISTGGTVNVIAYQDTTIVGGGTYVLTPAGQTWERIAVPVSYTSDNTPDRIVVIFTSGVGLLGTDTLGANGINVDDVSMSYAAQTGIDNIAASKIALTVYPNPSDAAFNFVFNKMDAGEKYQIVVHDIAGRQVYKKQLNSARVSVNLEGNAHGIYEYSILTSKNQLAQTGKLILK